MKQENKSSISKEEGKEYVEVRVYDCKSCGRKGFESSVGIKHEEKCLSKTAVFVGRKKTNQIEKRKVDSEKYDKLPFLFLIFFFLIFIDTIRHLICYFDKDGRLFSMWV